MAETQYPRDTCYFCEDESDIESHHIFPDRYGGPDTETNLVDLCKECHKKIEQLYGDAFWKRLNISKANSPPVWEDEDIHTVEWDIDPDEIRNYTPERCMWCERMGPFKEVTHQPSGLPAWICSRCDNRDDFPEWTGIHVWVGPNGEYINPDSSL